MKAEGGNTLANGPRSLVDSEVFTATSNRVNQGRKESNTNRFCVSFANAKLSSGVFVYRYTCEWSRDLQEIAETWVLERGRSVGHLVAILLAVIYISVH